MDITEARACVGIGIKDFSAETPANIDRAIMQVGDEFCRRTRAITRADDVAITSGSADFPLTTPMTFGFRPERIIDAFIIGQEKPFTIISYPALNDLTINGVPDFDAPAYLAFISTTAAAATLWPTPSAAYTAKLRYWQPFGITVSTTFNAGWTPGTADAPTLAGTLNIPNDLIRPVLSDGVGAVLTSSSKEAAYASLAWKRFLAHCDMCASANRLGVKVAFRNSSCDRRPRRVIREIY